MFQNRRRDVQIVTSTNSLHILYGAFSSLLRRFLILLGIRFRLSGTPGGGSLRRLLREDDLLELLTPRLLRQSVENAS